MNMNTDFPVNKTDNNRSMKKVNTDTKLSFLCVSVNGNIAGAKFKRMIEPGKSYSATFFDA